MVDCPVSSKLDTPYMILGFATKMYNNFEYTYDGISDLFDSMKFPAECYNRLVTSIFKDDCDGFHAAVYHIAYKNKLETYLLTYVTKTLIGSHTVCLIKYLDRYWVVDYNSLLVKDSLEGVLNETIKRRHEELLTYNLTEFNYNSGKYEIVEKEI